jgi:hypothetical protein
MANAITLTVPADASSVRVLRVVTTGVASTLELSFDSVDDLRIAVTEAADRLLGIRPGGSRLSLVLQPSADRLTLTVSVDAEGASWPDDIDGSLHRRIIAGLTDEAEERLVEGMPAIVMYKRTLTNPAG